MELFLSMPTNHRWEVPANDPLPWIPVIIKRVKKHSRLETLTRNVSKYISYWQSWMFVMFGDVNPVEKYAQSSNWIIFPSENKEIFETTIYC